MIIRIKNKVHEYIQRFVFRDKLALEFARWFKDKGDSRLRLEYPINSNSIVFDIGGYKGDFAAEIHDKYDCYVYIFEPITEFYSLAVERFKHNKKITCFNFGLSSSSGFFDISFDNNASSFTHYKKNSELVRVQTKSIVSFIEEFKLNKIDLMKINIEGGEFDILPALIKSNLIARINFLQVQFHSFVPESSTLRVSIRDSLLETHYEMWNYEFVWESWALKKVLD